MNGNGFSLATIAHGGPDGRLVVLSSGHERFIGTDFSLQSALEKWSEAEPILEAAAARLAAGEGEPFDPSFAISPLPRLWQWIDASTYCTHHELMATALGIEDVPVPWPRMYQGLGGPVLGPKQDVPLPTVDDFIDFEGEFGVIVDHVPMGTSAEDALRHVRLVVLINDWSLRRLAPIEMRAGFGWIRAKPAISLAPVAVTPAVLGSQWRNGRVEADLEVRFNGKAFGHPNGREAGYGFGELIAHAAYSRDLVAGTLIGAGTTSNRDYETVGSACIAERRAIETIASGAPETSYMAFGDRVEMEARSADGRSLFGLIDQKVVLG